MPYLVNVIELLDVFVNYTGNQTRNRRFILHKTIRELEACTKTCGKLDPPHDPDALYSVLDYADANPDS